MEVLPRPIPIANERRIWLCGKDEACGLDNGIARDFADIRRKRVHGAETDLQAVNGGNGMCNYPVSNIQYPLFNDGGANWILAVGCWIFAHFHIQQERSSP